jgi:adenylosuccinate synthase
MNKAVLGIGYGDEGKGITTDYLCPLSFNPMVVRFSGGQQAGHCQVGDTLITTINGLFYIKDLVGEKTNVNSSFDVINMNLESEKTSLLYKEKNKKVNKILLSNGVEFGCTSSHKYFVWNSINMSCEWVESVYLNKNIHQFIFPKKYDNYIGNDLFDLSNIDNTTDFIHNKVKINIKKIDIYDISELMGLVNGDGMFTKKGLQIIFNKKQKDVLETVVNSLKNMGINYTIKPHKCKSCLILYIWSTDFLNILLKLGCFFKKGVEKRTPTFVLNGTKKIIKSYLRGLFDTDGCVSFHKKKQNIYGRIKFSNTSEILIREMQQMLYLIGIHSHVSIYKNKKKKRLTVFNIEISSIEDIIKFSERIGFISKYNNNKLDKLIELKQNKNPNLNGVVLKVNSNFKKNFLKILNKKGRNNNNIRTNFILNNKSKIQEEYNYLIELLETYNLINIKEIVLNDRIENVYDITMPNTHSYISNGTISHNTVILNDIRHVFSNFGSGTLREIPSYWAKYCTVDPVGLINELDILIEKGVQPLLYIDERCPITTPFDIFYNHESEKTNNHGSVGVGVGATINREEKFYSLQFGDLFYEPVMRIKLNEIKKFYNLNFEINLDRFFQSIERIISSKNIKPVYDFPFSENYIFEGSQGLLLDPNIGFFPHVTRSYVSTKNIIDAGFKPELYLVTRAYQTRHGNGAMIGENIPHNILVNPNETNVMHPHQGEFRRALLNLDLLTYSVNKDPYIRFCLNKTLVITCLDHIVNDYRFTYKNEIITSSNENSFIQKVSKILDIKNVLISKSDESKNIIKWN